MIVAGVLYAFRRTPQAGPTRPQTPEPTVIEMQQVPKPKQPSLESIDIYGGDQEIDAVNGQKISGRRI